MKRRPFTQEEEQAIRDGVRRLGVGKWALILDNSDGVLDSRTGTNIKDRYYRNMLKNGDI